MRNMTMLIVLIVIPLGLIMFPTTVLLGFALLPTFVAWIMERGRPHAYGIYCVGGFNMAGVAPYMTEMWFTEHTVSAALGTLSDVFALLVIFGSAAFGWLVYASTPSLVATFMAMTAGRRITALKAQQATLVQKWGNDVKSSYETGDGSG